MTAIITANTMPYAPGNANDRVKMFNLIKFLKHIRFSPGFTLMDMHSGEGIYQLTDGRENFASFRGTAATAIDELCHRVDNQMNCYMSEINPAAHRVLKKNMAPYRQRIRSLIINPRWQDAVEELYGEKRFEYDVKLIISDPATMRQHMEIMSYLEILLRNDSSMFLYIPEDISPNAQNNIVVGNSTFTQTQIIRDTEQRLKDGSRRGKLVHLKYQDIDYDTGNPKTINHYFMTSPDLRALNEVKSAYKQSKRVFENQQKLESMAYRADCLFRGEAVRSGII